MKRQQIVDAVEAQFKTIKTAAGYYSELGNKIYVWKTSDWKNENMPGADIRDLSDSIIEGATIADHFLHEHKLNIEIEIKAKCLIPELRKMIADIHKAIKADITWGGLASDTQFTPGVNNEMDADQGESKVAGAMIRIDIFYRTFAFEES